MNSQEFGKAYSTGYRQTVSFLLRRGFRLSDAREIAQAAWVRGFERYSELRDDRRIVDWVNSIARNLAVSISRRDQHLEPLAAREPVVASAINLAAIDLRRILQTCPPRQIHLLRCVYLDGWSPKELARELSVSVGAIHSALFRARRALQEQLKAA